MRLVGILTIVLATMWLVLAFAAPTLVRLDMTTALSRYGSSQVEIEAIVASEQAHLRPRLYFGFGIGVCTLCAGVLILRRIRLGLWLLYASATAGSVGTLLLLASERPPGIVSVVMSLALWLLLARFAHVRHQTSGRTWWRRAA